MLSCPNGHSFDANKRGYLTTLNSSKGIVGDPRELLEARAAFLAAGHYQPIADAVVAALPQTPVSVVDAGTGTGYYLARVLRQSAGSDALALDASSAAVVRAIAATGAAGLVADTWQPLAIRDDRADVLLCVFAPRNSSEFSRILRSDGLLVVVTPGPNHLRELREAGLVIGMQEDKRERLEQSLGAMFELTSLTELSYQIELDTESAHNLTTMGPSGHHAATGVWAGGLITVEVDVTAWRRRS